MPQHLSCPHSSWASLLAVAALCSLACAPLAPAQNAGRSFFTEPYGFSLPLDDSGRLAIASMTPTVAANGGANGLVFVQDRFPGVANPAVVLRSVTWPSGSERWRVSTIDGLDFRRGAPNFSMMADLNGDGTQEILAATPGNNSFPRIPARLHVLNGGNGASLFSVDEPAGSFGAFGSFPTDLGDLDGDGTREFSASGFTGAYIFSTRPGGALLTATLPSLNGAIPWQPFRVEEAGNTRLAVVSNSGGFLGVTIQIWNIAGFASTLERTLTVNGANATNMLPAGDVDGDGTTDWFGIVPSLSSPAVALISGATGLDLWRSSGFLPVVQAGAGFGGNLLLPAVGGDYDGDGVQDFAVGMPNVWLTNGNVTGRRSEGAAMVFSGADGSVLTRVYGVEDAEFTGASVRWLSEGGAGGRDAILVAHPNPSLPSDTTTLRAPRFTSYFSGVRPTNTTAPEFTVLRVNDQLVIAGGPPNGTATFGASFGVTTTGTLRTIDLALPNFLGLFPISFGPGGSYRTPLPVGLTLPEFSVQAIDPSFRLTPAATFRL